MKHTPGPWEITHRCFAVVHREINGTDIVITDMVHADGSEKEAIANAHLIAAAPDLLEALLELRIFLGDGPLDSAAKYGPDYDAKGHAEYLAGKSDAAIAKAKGET